MKCDTCRQIIFCYGNRRVVSHGDHTEEGDCPYYEKKGEVKAMKLELGERRVTVLEVVAMLPECGEAVKLFRDWLMWYHTIRPIRWLEMHPEAIPWAIEKGFVKEVKPPAHDWSGLEFRTDQYGVYIFNTHTDKSILRFRDIDGRVETIGHAGHLDDSILAGHFDSEGRIIIDGEI
jgi:hypothetical protein